MLERHPRAEAGAGVELCFARGHLPMNKDLLFSFTKQSDCEAENMTQQHVTEYDYVIIGGGIGGCVVASRLSRHSSKPSVILIEAGPDVSKHPLAADAFNAQKIRSSELNWNYASVPQKHLDGRVCMNGAGKALGGGSAINTGKTLLSTPDLSFSDLNLFQVDG